MCRGEENLDSFLWITPTHPAVYMVYSSLWKKKVTYRVSARDYQMGWCQASYNLISCDSLMPAYLGNIGLCHVTSCSPSHHINQCWLFVKHTLKNKSQCKCCQNKVGFVKANTLENVVSTIPAFAIGANELLHVPSMAHVMRYRCYAKWNPWEMCHDCCRLRELLSIWRQKIL